MILSGRTLAERLEKILWMTGLAFAVLPLVITGSLPLLDASPETAVSVRGVLVWMGYTGLGLCPGSQFLALRRTWPERFMWAFNSVVAIFVANALVVVLIAIVSGLIGDNLL